jgi:hypothetical protein
VHKPRPFSLEPLVSFLEVAFSLLYRTEITLRKGVKIVCSGENAGEDACAASAACSFLLVACGLRLAASNLPDLGGGFRVTQRIEKSSNEWYNMIQQKSSSNRDKEPKKYFKV